MKEIKIEYDGEYPNLCRGNMTVFIDGEKWEFPQWPLASTGGIFNEELQDYIPVEGLWKVRYWPEKFPESLKNSVIDAINDQVKHGCCGGCI